MKNQVNRELPAAFPAPAKQPALNTSSSNLPLSPSKTTPLMQAMNQIAVDGLIAVSKTGRSLLGESSSEEESDEEVIESSSEDETDEEDIEDL